ncbi:MAG: hypothetical protein [Bacteriophage sp.]|nr:MAG: hypothetical protein [Bacteriophage sp.]WQZ00918.1 glutamine phosphoribosylpyrophosphate amidotransferase [Stenotrophomonas phage StenR_269]
MCVAAVVPPGKRLSEDVLRAMHQSNRDSWGFGFWTPYATPNPPGSTRPEGFLITVKNTTTSDDMVESYDKALKIEGRNEKPHLVHFRIRTSGLVNHVNAHPFNIKGGLLIHNGMLDGHDGGNYSDTYYFSKVFGDHLPKGITPEQKEFLGKLVGSYNKIAVLHDDGSTTIVNEDKGSYLDDGVWVSNTGWKHNLKR